MCLNDMCIVLTGPPGAGKTTTLQQLAMLGQQTVPEAARILISEEQARPDGVFPWTDLPQFAAKLLNRQIAQFDEVIGTERCVVFDRGLPDVLAFLQYHKFDISDDILRLCSSCRYGFVFDLEIVVPYSTDPQRPYDYVAARELAELNKGAYERLGYVVEHVPLLTPLERAKFILARIYRSKHGELK